MRKFIDAALIEIEKRRRGMIMLLVWCPFFDN
jgi:hypothetical protein